MQLIPPQHPVLQQQSESISPFNLDKAIKETKTVGEIYGAAFEYYTHAPLLTLNNVADYIDYFHRISVLSIGEIKVFKNLETNLKKAKYFIDYTNTEGDFI